MLKNVRTDLVLFTFSVLIFTLFPQIDIWTSALFFKSGFYLKDQFFFWWVYKIFGALPLILIPLLICLSIYFFIKYRDSNQTFKKNIYTFLTLSLVLGPGVLVNTILKNNSIGRARPSQITEFGGSADFTRAFEYSGACDKNCSFVSGHASMGFYFIALGWLFQSKRWFYTGLAIGAIVGLTRIVQGGHFLSDTIFALWAVYWVNLGLGKILKIKSPF
jgi:lipid A 4'-phosphatase